MSTLVAGPWVGEFGYELFAWQGAIRHIVKRDGYDQVVISSRLGHEHLYHDFCTKYIPYASNLNACDGRHGVVGLDQMGLTEQMFRGIPYMRALCPEQNLKNEPKEFINYGTKDAALGFDIVIHARGIAVEPTQMVRNNYAQKLSRNWSIDKWRVLVDKLLADKYHICCIGSPEASYILDGCTNLQGVSLAQLADILASSKLIVGPSSGPMHYATLCKCPQVTWGEPHLKERYQHLWNPFDTPVRFITTDVKYDPDVNVIYEAITKR